MTQPVNKPLQGKIAVVAGATRGAGRGIAVELGAAGATVYVTGRSVWGVPAGPVVRAARQGSRRVRVQLVQAAAGQ